MQSVRTAFVSLQKSLLQPTKNVVSINSQRTYVRNFWEENNDYKGIPGHTRNPPKMFGYTRSKRNMVREIHRPTEIKRIRVKGWDAEMSTPSGRVRIMKKYLEKSPFLAECI